MTAHIAVPALAPPDLPATLVAGHPHRPAAQGSGLQRPGGDRRAGDGRHRQGLRLGGSGGARARSRRRRAADAGRSGSGHPRGGGRRRERAAEPRSGSRRASSSCWRPRRRVGLARQRFVNLDAIGDMVDAPEASERAQEIADRAVTLVRNGGNLVPLAAPEHACYVTMAESRYSTEGQTFTQELRKRAPRAAVAALDASMSRAGPGRRRSQAARLRELRGGGLRIGERLSRLGGARGRTARRSGSADLDRASRWP